MNSLPVISKIDLYIFYNIISELPVCHYGYHSYQREWTVNRIPGTLDWK